MNIDKTMEQGVHGQKTLFCRLRKIVIVLVSIATLGCSNNKVEDVLLKELSVEKELDKSGLEYKLVKGYYLAWHKDAPNYYVVVDENEVDLSKRHSIALLNMKEIGFFEEIIPFIQSWNDSLLIQQILYDEYPDSLTVIPVDKYGIISDNQVYIKKNGEWIKR